MEELIDRRRSAAAHKGHLTRFFNNVETSCKVLMKSLDSRTQKTSLEQCRRLQFELQTNFTEVTSIVEKLAVDDHEKCDDHAQALDDFYAKRH